MPTLVIEEEKIEISEEYNNTLLNAIHSGCPHSIVVMGEVLCPKYPSHNIQPRASLIPKDKCPRLDALVIRQLKDASARQGIGFLIVPDEKNFGDATVFILGPKEIIFKGRLSEMFAKDEHSFSVLPSYRIFTPNGTDHTQQAMKLILDKGYELAANESFNPFSSIDDADMNTQDDVDINTQEGQS